MQPSFSVEDRINRWLEAARWSALPFAEPDLPSKALLFAEQEGRLLDPDPHRQRLFHHAGQGRIQGAGRGARHRHPG